MKTAHPLSVDVATIYNIPVEEAFRIRPTAGPLYSLLQRGLIEETEFWKEISAILKKPLLPDCKKLSREFYEKDFFLHAEMFEFVKELKKKKIITAVLSNITEFEADVIRKNNGYKDFDVLILSYKEKLEKPGKDIYLLTIKRLGLKPSECIFIDDKEVNLPPAADLGIKTVLAVNSKQTIKDVNSIIESQK